MGKKIGFLIINALILPICLYIGETECLEKLINNGFITIKVDVDIIKTILYIFATALVLLFNAIPSIVIQVKND